ncbi:hypothetical protein V6N11_008898 [Hibiscus sabdariffa]|uniref:Uncharacterized protein n=1 Tax=Hibiscus sabdariffa TaxID=183260 RepID=A0ABR2PP53_9ROSI
MLVSSELESDKLTASKRRSSRDWVRKWNKFGVFPSRILIEKKWMDEGFREIIIPAFLFFFSLRPKSFPDFDLRFTALILRFGSSKSGD